MFWCYWSYVDVVSGLLLAAVARAEPTCGVFVGPHMLGSEDLVGRSPLEPFRDRWEKRFAHFAPFTPYHSPAMQTSWLSVAAVLATLDGPDPPKIPGNAEYGWISNGGALLVARRNA